MHVVHGQDQRLLQGEQLERASHRDAEGAGVEWLVRLLHEERNLERMPSGRRQRGQDVVHEPLDEIAEAGESEVLLGLGWSAGEDTQPSLLCELETSKPERRLPDPGRRLRGRAPAARLWPPRRGMPEVA